MMIRTPTRSTLYTLWRIVFRKEESRRVEPIASSCHDVLCMHRYVQRPADWSTVNDRVSWISAREANVCRIRGWFCALTVRVVEFDIERGPY
jgi:hypothetical protein